jgi:hypothetical protein
MRRAVEREDLEEALRLAGERESLRSRMEKEEMGAAEKAIVEKVLELDRETGEKLREISRRAWSELQRLPARDKGRDRSGGALKELA